MQLSFSISCGKYGKCKTTDEGKMYVSVCVVKNIFVIHCNCPPSSPPDGSVAEDSTSSFFDVNLRRQPSTSTIYVNLQDQTSTPTIYVNLLREPTTSTFYVDLRRQPSTSIIYVSLSATSLDITAKESSRLACTYIKMKRVSPIHKRIRK